MKNLICKKVFDVNFLTKRLVFDIGGELEAAKQATENTLHEAAGDLKAFNPDTVRNGIEDRFNALYRSAEKEFGNPPKPEAAPFFERIKNTKNALVLAWKVLRDSKVEGTKRAAAEVVQLASGLADEASKSPEELQRRVDNFIHNYDSGSPLDDLGSQEFVKTLYEARAFVATLPTAAMQGYILGIYMSLGPDAAKKELERATGKGSSDIRLASVLNDDALKDRLGAKWFSEGAQDSQNFLLAYVIAANNLPDFNDADKTAYADYVDVTFKGLQAELQAIYNQRGFDGMHARLIGGVLPPKDWKKARDASATPVLAAAEPAKPASKPKAAPGGARKLDAKKSVVAGAPVAAVPVITDITAGGVGKGEKGGKAPEAEDAAEASAKTDGADPKRADMPNPYAPAESADKGALEAAQAKVLGALSKVRGALQAGGLRNYQQPRADESDPFVFNMGSLTSTINTALSSALTAEDKAALDGAKGKTTMLRGRSDGKEFSFPLDIQFTKNGVQASLRPYVKTVSTSAEATVATGDAASPDSPSKEKPGVTLPEAETVALISRLGGAAAKALRSTPVPQDQVGGMLRAFLSKKIGSQDLPRPVSFQVSNTYGDDTQTFNVTVNPDRKVSITTAKSKKEETPAPEVPPAEKADEAVAAVAPVDAKAGEPKQPAEVDEKAIGDTKAKKGDKGAAAKDTPQETDIYQTR